MIGWLYGTFLSEQPGGLIMQVGGVGYVVFASNRTLHSLPRDETAFSLFIETHVREDHIHLYGFASPQEQAMFRSLLSVQGVGAKMALALLSALEPDQLINAIHAEDKAMLTRADGVGPKLAVRIITELKDKLALDNFSQKGGEGIGTTSPTTNNAQRDQTAQLREDALSALANLGYGRGESYQTLSRILLDYQERPLPELGDLIREALQQLGQNA